MTSKLLQMRTLCLAGLLLAACGGQEPVQPPQPQPFPTTIQPPAPELSTIVVPIRVSLAPLADEVDDRVASKFSDTHRQNGIDIRYDVSRDPLAIGMVGAGLHTSTTIRYSIEACRGRFPCLSCGVREPRREAQITMHTALQWDPSWRLRSTTNLLPVHYARRCEVTWFDFDVTQRFVAPVIERQLREAAGLIDRQMPAMTNVRPTAAQVWDLLQKPHEVGPRTWLALEPTAVALSPIRGTSSTAETVLQLQAYTRVVIGNAPQPSRRPLPPLQPQLPAGDGLRIPFDLSLPYSEASAIATRDFGGRTYRVDGRDLRVEDLRLGPAPGGKVQLVANIDYRGGTFRSYRGPVILEGTPQLEGATSTLVVPDLEYTLDGRRGNPFLRAVERAAHANVRASLRQTARFPLAPQLTEARAGINGALNRPLAPGVDLRGTIRSIDAQAVTPLLDAISVRLLATGSAEVRTR